MKKSVFAKFLFLSFFMSCLFVSCGEKSKEEKFLSDFEELVEKAEEVKTKQDLESFITFAEQCEKKLDDLYGVNNLENALESGLNFSDEQKERYYKLMERMASASARTQEIYRSKDSSDEDTFDSDAVENDSDDNAELSASGSEDWDELLKSYEEYVDKYISYLKKASKGDMNALSEYPALLEKAQEFSEKMENAQGSMSSSQWSRYLDITNKMTKAAQEMSN